METTTKQNRFFQERLVMTCVFAAMVVVLCIITRFLGAIDAYCWHITDLYPEAPYIVPILASIIHIFAWITTVLVAVINLCCNILFVIDNPKGQV